MRQLRLIIGLILFSSVSFAETSSLKSQPDEETAYNIALTQSWQPTKMDMAASSFEAFLKKYPAHKEAWIAYANLESWRKRYGKAFSLLNHYRKHFGSTKEYLCAHARLLALVGHYNKALAMNTPLLHEDPNNFDLQYTHVNALYKAKHFKEARRELQKLKIIDPNNNDTKALEETFHTLVESMLSGGLNYFHDNLSIKNWTIPLSFDWAFNDNTHFVFQGLHEVVSAGKGSGSETIHGHTTLYDNSFMAGINWRIAPNIAISGLAGDLKIEGLNNKFIYLVNANINLAETANIELLQLHNLYRPYLYPTSPKAVSMGIVEDLTRMKLNVQPFLESNIALLVGYSTLSDGNHYMHADFAPTREFAINSNIDMAFGADVEFLFFDKQLHDGYYDPKSHQEYLATANLNYNPTAHFSCNLSVGAGTHQDQLTDGFRPAARAYASANTHFSAWEISISYDYTYQGAASDCHAYQGSSIEAHASIRF